MANEASGYECPDCGYLRANILHYGDGMLVLLLECKKCGCEWPQATR